jgi:tRNA (cmo5U34)-methyltransferase
MPEWTEDDSATFREIAAIAVPRRREMTATIISLVPFAAADTFRIVELGAGEGALSAALLDAHPNATLLALDGSASMRAAATTRLAPFGDRARVRAFDLASLDWWDSMHGASLVVSSLCLHHLNDAKKQYLYKAVADRLAPGGAFLVADLVEPLHAASRRLAADEWDRNAREQADMVNAPALFARFEAAQWNDFRFPSPADHPAALFHHLVWLKHAGFGAVECFWMFAGHAVYGGFK